MNVSEAWEYGRSRLRDSPTPQLDARLLLEHVLKTSHSWLLAHGDEALATVQETQYLHFIERAQLQEPIPYLIGQAPFCGLDFIVNESVLIPRPETEHLVEIAVAWGKRRPSPKIVDVGTGSGCIAVILARQLPQASIEATDISAAALAVASRNAKQHDQARIRFHRGSLLDPISPPIDLITANLPYVTDGEWTMLDDGVKSYEPSIALKGGADGLDLMRQLFKQATTKLSPQGAMFMEIGWQQGTAVQQLAQSIFPAAHIEIMTDFSGHDRIAAIRLNVG